MNREIKFRVWDGSKIHPVRDLGFRNGHVTIGREGLIAYVSSSRATPEVILMQYTGLKDKNGVEIYEGDILEYPNAYQAVVERVLDAGTGNGDEKNGWYIRWLDDGTFDDIPLAECGTGKIIGNIYENPELVE